MTGRRRSALVVVSLGIAGFVIQAHAQSAARQAPVRVTQLAYLKASNAEAGDHFGCGGVLDGHAGFGTAISGDGNTMVVGAPHESQRRPRRERQPERQLRGRRRRGLRFRSQRRQLGAAGIPEGVQSVDERRVRARRRHQRRRQHHRRIRVLGPEQGHRRQRRSKRPVHPASRRCVRVHAPRRGMVAAGVPQGVEYRRGGHGGHVRQRRPVRLLRRHQRRREHRRGGCPFRRQQRHQRQPGRQLDGARRCRLRLQPHEYDVGADRLPQGDESRRRRHVRVLGRAERRRPHDRDRRVRRGRLLPGDQRMGGQRAQRRGRRLRLRQAAERVLVAAGLHPRQQRGGGRFVRRPRRDQRRRQHLAGGLVGRGLPGDGHQSHRSRATAIAAGTSPPVRRTCSSAPARRGRSRRCSRRRTPAPTTGSDPALR